MREVMEVAVFWRGDLLSVDYVSPRARVERPEIEGVEVRTRLVEASLKTPRPPMDVPYFAIAAVAACAHAIVLGGSSYSESIDVTGPPGIVVAATSSSDGDLAPGEPGTSRGAPSSIEGHGEPLHEALAEISETGSLEEASGFGMIGLLRRYDGQGATPWANAPSGDGALWGDQVGDAWGAAGIALSGVGEGAGGRGLGVRMIEGVRTTTGEGYGAAHGHLSGRHAPIIRCTLTSEPVVVSDRLPAETIQRVVRDNLGRFRGCYTSGLARDPKLAGRVSTKFAIARDGTVATVADAGSDLPDADVVSCIQRAFSGLEFPASPAGVVTVIYPLDLQPAE